MAGVAEAVLGRVGWGQLSVGQSAVDARREEVSLVGRSGCARLGASLGGVAVQGMDPLGFLAIRIHYGGEFFNVEDQLQYFGGTTGMSNIELDKLSFSEVKGHLGDHMNIDKPIKLYWLPSGIRFGDGLQLICDDETCNVMAQYTKADGVADIYVDDIVVLEKEDNDWGLEMDELEEDADDDANDELEEDVDDEANDEVEKKILSMPVASEPLIEDNWESSDKSDSDFQPKEVNSSGEDEETEQLRMFAKQVKDGTRAKKLGHNRGQALILADALVPEFDNLQDHDNTYLHSSDEYSYGENSEGETIRWQSTENRFDTNAPIPAFALGMAFRCSRQFKKALIKYGLVTHKHLLFPKNEKNKVKSICSWKGCKWMIYGSKTSRSEWFKVVTFVDEHCCPLIKNNKLMTSRRIADRYWDEIRDNPTWKVELIKKAVLKDMLCDVSISQCKRAKALVLQEALCATKGEYSRVFDYQLELLRTNPVSTIIVTLNPDILLKNVFQRFYVCFDACKKGFLAGCRRVVGLDGCFFKGATNGELLCAVGRDANNQMYPVAWASVEKETYDSWYWFLGLLLKDLNINDGGEGWVFISDQQKGLLKAVAELVPRGEHRMCARHIYANWRKKHPGQKLQRKFWKCAKSSCRILFNYNKAKMAQETPQGAKDMVSTSPEHWSRAFFRLGSNCDSVDNNMCESFNNWVMDSRFLPVISMNKLIRCKIMIRIQENRTKAENWQGTICPNIFRKLKLNIDRSGRCHVLWNGQDGFEVKEKDKRKFTVNLDKKTCSCRYWQLSGLPCCHAISAIYMASKTLDDFIAPCYSITEYMKTYQYCLQPVEGQESWPVSDMPKPLPPAYVRMPGRPKTQRTREQQEKPKGTKLTKVGVQMKCSLCHSTSHNRRRCSLSKEAGNKNNAYIKRDAARKRKAREDGLSVITQNVPRSAPAQSQDTNTRGQQPRTAPSQNQQVNSTRQVPMTTRGRNNHEANSSQQVPTREQNQHVRRRGGWCGSSRLANLLFGDNFP